MKMIVKHIETLYAPATADAMVVALQANDDDWTYKAVHDPKGTGKSYIAIYDEDGEYVGKY